MIHNAQEAHNHLNSVAEELEKRGFMQEAARHRELARKQLQPGRAEKEDAADERWFADQLAAQETQPILPPLQPHQRKDAVKVPTSLMEHLKRLKNFTKSSFRKQIP